MEPAPSLVHARTHESAREWYSRTRRVPRTARPPISAQRFLRFLAWPGFRVARSRTGSDVVVLAGSFRRLAA